MAFTFRNILDVMPSKANWIAIHVTARSQLCIRLNLPELCRDHEIFTAFGKAKAAAKKRNAALKQDFSQLDKEMLYWTMSSIFLQMAYNRHLNDITFVMGIAAHPKEVFGKIVLPKDVFFEFFDFYMHTPGNLLTQIISGDVAFAMMLLMLAQSYLKKTGQTQEQEMLYDSVHCHLQCSSLEELRAFIRFLREAKVNEKTYILTACPNTTKKLPTQIWFPAYVAEWIVDPLMERNWTLFFNMMEVMGLAGCAVAIGVQILHSANPRSDANHIDFSSREKCIESLKSIINRYYRLEVHQEDMFESGSAPIFRCPMYNKAALKVSEQLTLEFKENECDKKFPDPLDLYLHVETHNRDYFRDCDECGDPVLDYGGAGFREESQQMFELYHLQRCPNHKRKYSKSWSAPAGVAEFKFPERKSIPKATRMLITVDDPMFIAAPRNDVLDGVPVTVVYIMI